MTKTPRPRVESIETVAKRIRKGWRRHAKPDALRSAAARLGWRTRRAQDAKDAAIAAARIIGGPAHQFSGGVDPMQEGTVRFVHVDATAEDVREEPTVARQLGLDGSMPERQLSGEAFAQILRDSDDAEGDAANDDPGYSTGYRPSGSPSDHKRAGIASGHAQRKREELELDEAVSRLASIAERQADIDAALVTAFMQVGEPIERTHHATTDRPGGAEFVPVARLVHDAIVRALRKAGH